MTRKILIDGDPGIDEALAITMALFDPRLEVVAITACAGIVEAHRSGQNLLSLIESLDPPKRPRLAVGSDPEGAPTGDWRSLHGEDGLGNIQLPPVGRHHAVASEKLIAEQLRTYAGRITCLTTGPLTSIAKVFQKDPALQDAVDRLVVCAGSLDGIGDVTAVAEFNAHFDPGSASAVFRSSTTKSLVPLHTSRQLSFGWELMERLPGKWTRAGRILHPMATHFFRAARHSLGVESFPMPAITGLLAILHPELFRSEEVSVEIELEGDKTRGMTWVDRRIWSPQGKGLEVLSLFDPDGARDAVFALLDQAGQAT